MNTLPITHTIQISNTESGVHDPKLPLPKPFHTTENGTITRHVSMEGGSVIGFCYNPEPGTLDLQWRQFLEDPQAAVGLFTVAADPLGHFALWAHPVTEVTIHPLTSTSKES